MTFVSDCRTLLVLHVGCDGAKINCKDGRVITLSYDGRELHDFMLSQVSWEYFALILFMRNNWICCWFLLFFFVV